jgi:hypothetical protein
MPNTTAAWVEIRRMHICSHPLFMSDKLLIEAEHTMQFAAGWAEKENLSFI